MELTTRKLSPINQELERRGGCGGGVECHLHISWTSRACSSREWGWERDYAKYRGVIEYYLSKKKKKMRRLWSAYQSRSNPYPDYIRMMLRNVHKDSRNSSRSRGKLTRIRRELAGFPKFKRFAFYWNSPNMSDHESLIPSRDFPTTARLKASPRSMGQLEVDKKIIYRLNSRIIFSSSWVAKLESRFVCSPRWGCCFNYLTRRCRGDHKTDMHRFVWVPA